MYVRAAQPAVLADPAWARAVRRFGRAAVWALPGCAAALLLHTVKPIPWADAAGTWLGLVGLVALAALLAGVRGRRFAVAGLLTGLAAGAAALLLLGPGILGAAPAGPVAGRLTLAGGGLAVLSGVLFGVAVLRSRVLDPADGGLLVLAALLGAGGLSFRPLWTVGALLFLAGTLGLAWTAARLTAESVRA
jgi:Amt family ammonium transporter